MGRMLANNERVVIYFFTIIFQESLGPLLHEAVSEGQVQVVRTILAKPGININHRNEVRVRSLCLKLLV